MATPPRKGGGVAAALAMGGATAEKEQEHVGSPGFWFDEGSEGKLAHLVGAAKMHNIFSLYQARVFLFSLFLQVPDVE